MALRFKQFVQGCRSITHGVPFFLSAVITEGSFSWT